MFSFLYRSYLESTAPGIFFSFFSCSFHVQFLDTLIQFYSFQMRIYPSTLFSILSSALKNLHIEMTREKKKRICLLTSTCGPFKLTYRASLWKIQKFLSSLTCSSPFPYCYHFLFDMSIKKLVDTFKKRISFPLTRGNLHGNNATT